MMPVKPQLSSSVRACDLGRRRQVESPLHFEVPIYLYLLGLPCPCFSSKGEAALIVKRPGGLYGLESQTLTSLLGNLAARAFVIFCVGPSDWWKGHEATWRSYDDTFPSPC